MASDPYLDAIHERLKGKLDGDVFEACVVDLLQEVYPTLVLIPGGSDSGRDGVMVGDREDAEFLVCTTQANPLRNLKKSLQSAVDHGLRDRRVIFATSQALSATKIEEARRIALEKGFHLINTYERQNLASRLYRHPEWCKRLLSLSGDPPALSVLPRSNRPLGEGHLIGRRSDAEWLTAQQRDCILVGQPGSGKTFLLYLLAQQHKYWFVISNDLGSIANDVRAKQPDALILDDAAQYLQLLRSLIQNRSTTGATYRIIATCWPADRLAVESALQNNADSHELERLTRDEIVEVIKANGIIGPPGFVRELVNQADGRPGLAVTLCTICLGGKARSVTLGEALSQDTKTTIQPLGVVAYPLLGYLALGGNAGINLAEAAEALELPLHIARHLATEMAASGVLRQVTAERISVRPDALCHALVRDLFFSTGINLPSESLIAKALNPTDVALTLAGARARGGLVPVELIIDTAARGRSSDPLKALAWIGPEEARTVLEHYPDLLEEIAEACLEHIPEHIIPLLLSKAVGDNRELHSTPSQPLRILQDWITSQVPGTDGVLSSRRTLHDCALRWIRSGGDTAVGVHGLMIALTPKYASHSLDPGAGRTVTFQSGSITSTDAEQVVRLWPEAMACLKTLERVPWKPVQHLVWQWCFPGSLGHSLTKEYQDLFRKFGVQMLTDLMPFSNYSVGVAQWLRRIFFQVGMPTTLSVTPIVDVIFPIERKFDVEESEEQHRAMETIAIAFARRQPHEVVKEIHSIVTDANDANLEYPRYDNELWYFIAKHVEDPLEWAREIIAQDGDPSVLYNFLDLAIHCEQPGTLALAEGLLSGQYRMIAAEIILSSSNCSHAMRHEACTSLVGIVTWSGLGVRRNRYPVDSLRVLLQSKDRHIAETTAINLWRHRKSTPVPDSLMPEWKSAVIAHVEDDYELQSMFAEHPELAFHWLCVRVQSASQVLIMPRDSVKHAVATLDLSQKLELLRQYVSPESHSGGLVDTLARSDIVLFREVLASELLKRWHLAPFGEDIDEQWVTRAIVALDAGYSPQEILDAWRSQGYSWKGDRSVMLEERLIRFKSLAAHTDSRVREISRLGSTWAEHERQSALKEERIRAVEGW